MSRVKTLRLFTAEQIAGFTCCKALHKDERYILEDASHDAQKSQHEKAPSTTAKT